MTTTPLDQAHEAMTAGGDAQRLRFYDRLTDAELFLLLAAESVADRIDPELFEVEDGRFVLAFDTEERLAEFAGAPAPYAALSGRAVMAMLAGQGIGLGLNLGVAASEFLMPAEAVDWLAQTLAEGPRVTGAKPLDMAPPHDVPHALLGAIDGKLAAAGGMALCAYLVSVTYAPATPGHMLAFIDAAPGAEAALSRAISEALIFSGLEAGEIDVAFFNASDPVAARLAKVGLRFDIPRDAQGASNPAQ